MFSRHLELKQLIDENGRVPAVNSKLEVANEMLAIDVVKSMLGMTLVVRKRRFVLTSLELYYGGIGDAAHDWHKRFYKKKSGVNFENVKTQLMSGPRIYINKKIRSPYRRMDIVLGAEGVAVSVLIRNVLDERGMPLADKNGSISIIKEMGILDQDHGKELSRNNDIFLEFEKSSIVRYFKLRPPQKRMKKNKPVGFECEMGNRNWNFSLVGE